mgnify:CR=1 FL=1
MMSGLLPPLSSRTSTMSHPTCCCSVSLDRCDRCDLLVDLEGFHLMSVARCECGLVLDIESCDRCAGCPGCGVIAQGHAHGGGGDRRALGRGPGHSSPVPHPRRGKKTQLSLASERTTLSSKRETISPCFSSVRVTLRANTMKDRTITVRGT